LIASKERLRGGRRRYLHPPNVHLIHRAAAGRPGGALIVTYLTRADGAASAARPSSVLIGRKTAAAGTPEAARHPCGRPEFCRKKMSVEMWTIEQAAQRRRRTDRRSLAMGMAGWLFCARRGRVVDLSS